jgi:hypothetical protein
VPVLDAFKAEQQALELIGSVLKVEMIILDRQSKGKAVNEKSTFHRF